MVKFGKNKFRALNKIAKLKNQKFTADSPGVSNKILKKKINADKKVTFQKEVLIKESVIGDNELVNKKSAKEVILNELSKKSEKKQEVKTAAVQNKKPPKKQKPVQKLKKRQRTHLDDTQLLLSLMK